MGKIHGFSEAKDLNLIKLDSSLEKLADIEKSPK